MRLILLIILIFDINNGFCQGLDENLKVLTYIKGCHGSCNFGYADSSNINNCGSEKDSIIDIVNIFRVNGDYYKNGKLINKLKADSLLVFIKNKKEQIKKLLDDVSSERKAKFVPPQATCFEFEEFQFYINGIFISYMILDNDKNESGSYLNKKDIELFNNLKELIK